ncbi:MAG: hypothetical protein ACOX8B_03055 [Lachnospiraceae bacterium]|jgi:hypothetical protein
METEKDSEDRNTAASAETGAAASDKTSPDGKVKVSPEISKEDHFRYTVKPRIFFWLGIAATAACLIIRLIFTPDALHPIAIAVIMAIGAILGIALGIYTKKKVKKSRDFFDMFNSMRMCWIIGLILMLCSFSGGWPYGVALFIPPLCIPFFAILLPDYSRRKIDLYVSTHTTRT